MEAVIIAREITKKERNEIELLFSNKVKIFKKAEIQDYFNNYKIKEDIVIDESARKEINSQIMEDVLNFGELKINGKAITEYFTINHISIWHYSKFRIYFSVNKLYQELNLLQKLEKQFAKIHYYGDDSIIKKYYQSSKIIYHFKKQNKVKFNYIQILKYFIFFLLRLLIGVFQFRKIKNKKHLIIDHSEKQTILDINTLKPQINNYNLAYLFEKIDNEFMILDDINFPEKKITYRFKLKKNLFRTRNRLFGEQILFRALITPKIKKEIQYIRKQLNSLIKNFDTTSFNLKQIIIFEFFKKFSAMSFIQIFKYLSYRFFFEKHSFRTISTIDENSPRIKSILDAAKSVGIKTIGIQHGNINEFSPAYIYTEEDKKRKIMSDITLVWGEYWKDFMIQKGNYPADTIKITGQIRTDIIPKLLNNNLSINSLKDIKKKIVLFATQPQPDKELRRKTAESVFLSMKENKSLFLVLKLHPAEINDFDYYNAIAKSVNFFDYKILYWEDLYLLLSKASIVITSFSTVGSEAIYFNKPLIIVDPLKQDIQNYYKENVAFRAVNHEELTKILNRFSSNELLINYDSYKYFIKKYSFKIDGNVTERVLKTIKSQ